MTPTRLREIVALVKDYMITSERYQDQLKPDMERALNDLLEEAKKQEQNTPNEEASTSVCELCGCDMSGWMQEHTATKDGQPCPNIPF